MLDFTSHDAGESRIQFRQTQPDIGRVWLSVLRFSDMLEAK